MTFEKIMLVENNKNFYLDAYISDKILGLE